MTHNRSVTPKQILKPATLSLAIALCWGVAHAQTLPTGAQAIAGTATLSQVGKNLTVTTTNVVGGSHSAINWQSFSIGAGYATNFIQPSAASTSINRVVTNNPSQIFGTLSSNGKLVLVNPAGISVGKGAVVDTAGFTASTLAMAEKDAKAGLLRFAADGLAGDVNVHGRIISRGGDVVLFAPNVSTGSDAVIEAPDGTVTLAAGRSAQITGAGMDAVLLELKAPADSVLNLGTLKGNAVGIFASTLKHSGLIQASGVAVDSGKVRLVSDQSTVVDGSIRASRRNSTGETGGDVVLTSANSVSLAGNTVVDASGANGAGTVAVGGGWQGQRADVVNAQTTEVQQSALINASATTQGSGGTISVWSDGTTQTHGQLVARGAGAAGDGGKVETSGHTLVRSGLPDVTPGPGGKAGTWLIDPTDVVIQLGNAMTASPYNGSAASSQPTIFESEIETLGNTTDIQILAQRSIKAVAGTGSDQKLTVDGHSVSMATLNASTGSVCETTSACGIDLTAFTAGIQTKGGNFTAVTGLDTNTGATALNNTGVYAAPIALPGVNTSAVSSRTGNGSVFLSASGNVTVTGDIVTKATHVGAGQAGTVSINAAGTAALLNIDSSGGSFTSTDLLTITGGPIQSLNGASVNITANKVVLGGDIMTHAGSEIAPVAGDAVATTFSAFSSDTDMRGQGGSVGISAKGVGLASGEASIVFAKAFEHNHIDTSSGSPNAPISSGPGFQGGNVTIEAQQGHIDTGVHGVSIITKGGNGNPYYRHDGISDPGQGGQGGAVLVRANDSSLSGDGIVGNGLSIETYGGIGGRFNLSGQAADWGRGGQGGDVTVETAGRLSLDNIYVYAVGGGGSVGGSGANVRIAGQKGVAIDSSDFYTSGGAGYTEALAALAPLAEGGKAGHIAVDVGSGRLSKRNFGANNAYLRAEALGGNAYAYIGDTTMGGNGGTIRISGHTASQLIDEYQLLLNASGGGASAYDNPTARTSTATAPQPVSTAKGGSVEIEMGSMTLGASSQLIADGGNNPNTQSGQGVGGKIRLLALNGSISESALAAQQGLSAPIDLLARSHECGSASSDCGVELEAYNGGINLTHAGRIAAKRLEIRTSAQSGTATGSVSVAQTDVGYLRGAISGNLVMENINLGISQVNNSSLTLGYNDGDGLQGLSVDGTAQIVNSLSGEGTFTGGGKLRVAENAIASAQRWDITSGSLLMGNANSRLTATDSVNLRSGYTNLRLLGSNSSSSVTGTGLNSGFKLYQDTIAGINAPVLRLDNAVKGADAVIAFNSPNGETVDFTNITNANPNMRLVLNTSGKITQTSNTSVKVKELVAKGQSLDLGSATGNEIGHLSATVFGGPGQAGVISVKNGTGTITLGGLRDDDKSITDGLNASGNIVVQNAGAPDTVVQASVSIKSNGAIQLAGGITAPEISLETMGSITNTVAQVNTTTVNTNIAVNNPMPILDASSNSSSGVTSIRLLADGNIGDSSNEQSIGVKLGSSNKVLIGQPTGGTGSNLSGALHLVTGPTGTANTSQVLQSGAARDLSLQSEGAWLVDSALAARSIDLRANNGNVNFASGTVTGSLQGSNYVFVEAEKGGILGDPNAGAAQVISNVVGLMSRDGVSASVSANHLFARSEGGTGSTGSQDVNLKNTNNDPWTLAHAYSANGNINISSTGLIKVQGEYPFAGADQGKPLGIEGNSVSITGGGINVHRSVIARSGDLSLNAGSGDLSISRMPTSTRAAPTVELSGNNVSLRGQLVHVDSDRSPVESAASLPGSNNDTAPAYPVAGGSLATSPGDIKIGATSSLQIEASTGIWLENDIALAANNVNLHTSTGNVALENFNAVKGTGSVFVNAEAGAITGDFNANSPQVSSAVVGLIARDGVSAKVDAGVLFARSQGGTGAVANAQDVNVRNTRSDWTLATAASAGGNVTVVTSGHMRVQGEFPYAGADLGKPLGVEGNNVTLFADGGIDVHRSVIARSGNLVVDARNSNLLIAPKSTDLSTQPTPEVHLGGVSVNLYGQNITVTETPVTSTTPFTFSAPNTNSLSAPAYPALLGSVATDPGTVKIKATSTATLVANGTVDLQARNGLQADNMVSVEANGGAITGSNTGTAPQIKANMVTLSARDSITAQVDAALLLASSDGGAGATGTQNVTISNSQTDWTLAAAYSAGGNVDITGSGRIRVAGESPFSGADFGAPLGVSGKAVTITAANGLDVHRSVIARNGDLSLHAGSGDLIVSPKTTKFGEQSTPQVQLGGTNVNLEGRNVVITGVPKTGTPVVGTTYTYGSSSLMPYPQLGGSIAAEPGAVKVGATNALSVTATAGSITLQGGNNLPSADSDDVVAPAGSAVRLVAPSVNLTAQSLQVNGGAGSDAYASVQYSTALNLAISGSGSAISLNAGTGSNADAVVFSTASSSTLNTANTANMAACTTCPPTWYQGENPLNDSATNTGLGVSTTARPSTINTSERIAVDTTTKSNVSEQDTITATLVNTTSDNQPSTTTSTTEERKEKSKESVVVEAQGNVCT